MIKQKNAKGITLVALIITIIILLILAGVTLSLVIGENGLIEKSKQSANKYDDASGVERINMIVAEAQTKGYEQGNNGELTQANLQEALDNSYGVGKATASEKQADGSFIIKVGGREYKIDDSLGVSENKPIEKVQPKNIADWEYTTDTETNTIIINKYKGKDTEVIVPNYIGDIPVKAIEGTGENGSIWDLSICEEIRSGSSVENVQLTIEKINISEGIEYIGDKTFYNSRNLKNISLPYSIKVIGKEAFYCCYKLENIKIPTNVTDIGEQAFWLCKKLKSIIIPENVTNIKYGTFYACSSLENVTFPQTLTSIEMSAFPYCESLTKIKIPSEVNTIDKYAFSSCNKLKYIEIQSKVTNIGENAFKDISPDAQIICDFESKPENWASDWTNCTNIVWKRANNTST